MAGVVIFAGTYEGRRLVELFSHSRIPVHVSVTTEYGKELLPQKESIQVSCKKMEASEMITYLKDCAPELCLDATHPYAAIVTENVKKACEAANIPYLRVLRGEQVPEEEQDVIRVSSVAEAVSFLSNTKGNILVTTGSKEVAEYTKLPNYETRCFVRVLPSASVMEACNALGFKGRNLIGMQGPFSEELNLAMLKSIDAAYMVTKSTGDVGGFLEKCRAARTAGAKLIVVERPSSEEGMSLEEAMSYVKERFSIEYENEDASDFRITNSKKRVNLIGIGPGDLKQLTRKAWDAIGRSDLLIGAARMLQLCSGYSDKTTFASYKKEEILSYLKEHENWQEASLLFSGDIGFCSGASLFHDEELAGYEVERISGISSPIALFNCLGKSWTNTCFVSCHGKKTNLASLLKREKSICALLGTEENQVGEIAKELLANGFSNVRMTLGSSISYETEQIVSGLPEDFLEVKTPALGLLLLEQDMVEEVSYSISDEAFLRGKVPMTKEEIRLLSIAKLKLAPDSILYDIGAGTGSISVQVANYITKGQIYAIEKNPEAVELLFKNKERFHSATMQVIEGRAPEVLTEIAMAPTHVFLGGTDGNLCEIVMEIQKKNPMARFVLNSITLETLAKVMELRVRMPELAETMEIMQVQISKNKALGSYQRFDAASQIYIVSFGG